MSVAFCAEGFLDSYLNEEVINKHINFHEVVPNLTYSKRNVIFTMFGKI